VYQKVKKFLKWVSQYFTLVYVCKNGKLQQNLLNEINPLVFIDNICDFLYFNIYQTAHKQQQRSYYIGSNIALKTMLKFLNEIYDGQPEVFSKLEIVQILIQKVCHLAYGHEIPKKVAANRALHIIIEELPVEALKKHCFIFLESLFFVLGNS